MRRKGTHSELRFVDNSSNEGLSENTGEVEDTPVEDGGNVELREVESGLVFVESSERLDREVRSQVGDGGENESLRRGGRSGRSTGLGLEVDFGLDRGDGQGRRETEQIVELFDCRKSRQRE